MTYIALAIFLVAFALIISDLYDKSLVALAGAILMVLFGILSPEEAVSAIEYEAIFLLTAMMVMVNIASKSGIFHWLNVKIAALTKGNPLAIFLFFSLLTGLFSALLDNVTTIVLIVPLTIELLKGMGKDPKPYIFSEIMFANIGGDLTLIGDASNIIIGAASGLSFLDFINNLWIPVLAASIFTILVFVIVKWKELKPISDNLTNLFVANIIIRRIKNRFLKIIIHKEFVIKVMGLLFLTILGFLIQGFLQIPNYLIAFTGAILLGILCSKRVHIHEALKSVEWTTLFFFSGLFIMVAGLEKTGLLEELSQLIASSSSNIFVLSLIILWATGIFSMILDNVPFVTVMVPVIIAMQAKFPSVDTAVLWWALSMGACLGGNGTLIGGSANVVAAGLSKKEGLNIKFIEYLKFALPMTLGVLFICTVYLFFRFG